MAAGLQVHDLRLSRLAEDETSNMKSLWRLQLMRINASERTCGGEPRV